MKAESLSRALSDVTDKLGVACCNADAYRDENEKLRTENARLTAERDAHRAEVAQIAKIVEGVRTAMRTIGPYYYRVQDVAARAKSERAADELDSVYGRLFWMDFTLGTLQERVDADEAKRRAALGAGAPCRPAHIPQLGDLGGD